MTKSTDVLVVGAGMAGICAALGAAETGGEVVLLERSPILGGNATKSNVGTICGAFHRSLSGKILPSGNKFTREFVRELMKSQQVTQPVNYHNGLYIIPYEWSILLSFLEEQLEKRDNINVFRGVEVQDVHVTDKKIHRTEVRSVEGRQKLSFECTSIIDCSGNSIISQLAHLENICSDHYQAATQVFRLRGVNPTSEFSLNMAIKKALMNLTEEKKWPESFKVTSVVPGSLRKDSVDVKLTLPDEITDDANQQETLALHAVHYIRELLPVLKGKVESLQNARLEKVFPEPGVRVRKRSKGLYTLTQEDVVTCTKPPDGVASGVWPIEYWHTTGEVEMVYFDAEDHYMIPAGCLQSRELENLFFAGKNISATEKAIASARVIGTCIQTGYAAGKLAGCKNAPEREKVIQQLYQELKEGNREYS